MKWLTCFWCDKEFELKEVFISFSRMEEGNEGIIIHSQCLNCSGQYPSKEKEKKGGWIVLRRTLDGYEDAQNN